MVFPWWDDFFFVILQKILFFATALKNMDITLLLAYSITDGEFENMNQIQKSIILHIVENMLNEHTPPKAT